VTLFGPDLLGEKGPRPILTNKTEFVLFLCLFIFYEFTKYVAILTFGKTIPVM
jgi:hypothetical protein